MNIEKRGKDALELILKDMTVSGLTVKEE